ncbi:MAG: CoB--CoM heterodisulfide reductase iron-sulfur subunit D [Methanomassiliicoccales archaeon PtaB.Bin215]|nr:MAG: CoB--CoM heterodisulfide reductase iron-sulfur subunit D [Methanomassiliicoccales archaeon PtaB.Bin215]
MVSLSRFAARPVGAASRKLARLTVRTLSKLLTMVVLPVPGPPVIMLTRWVNAIWMALCCGSPLLKIGAKDMAEELRRRNAEVFSRYDRIITSCPGCTYQLREVYGVRAEHVIEVLKGLELRSGLQGRWALQIPCHLKRGVSPWAAEDLATVLEKAGVEVVRTTGEDACCGGGGGMLSGFPDTSVSMAVNKVEAYRKAGVDGVVTACPFCSLNLGREGIRVLDIGEAMTLKR